MQGWEQYFFVARRTMHAMCCQAPAVFELLPDPNRTEVWPLDRHPPQCSVYRREPVDPAADKADDIETEGADIGGEAVHVQLKDSLSDGGNVIRKDNYSIADFRTALGAALSDFEVRPVCRAASRGAVASPRRAQGSGCGELCGAARNGGLHCGDAQWHTRPWNCMCVHACVRRWRF